MPKVILAVGGNLGGRTENIRYAIQLLEESDCQILAKSNLYETDPVGYENQGKFLNGAIFLDTNKSPLELLKLCNGIEEKLGRVRTFKNAPRQIDLDIIFFENIQMQTEVLTIPHPRWAERDFVITPLLDLLDVGAFELVSFKKYATILKTKNRKFEVYKK